MQTKADLCPLCNCVFVCVCICLYLILHNIFAFNILFKYLAIEELLKRKTNKGAVLIDEIYNGS